MTDTYDAVVVYSDGGLYCDEGFESMDCAYKACYSDYANRLTVNPFLFVLHVYMFHVTESGIHCEEMNTGKEFAGKYRRFLFETMKQGMEDFISEDESPSSDKSLKI